MLFQNVPLQLFCVFKFLLLGGEMLVSPLLLLAAYLLLPAPIVFTNTSLLQDHCMGVSLDSLDKFAALFANCYRLFESTNRGLGAVVNPGRVHIRLAWTYG